MFVFVFVFVFVCVCASLCFLWDPDHVYIGMESVPRRLRPAYPPSHTPHIITPVILQASGVDSDEGDSDGSGARPANKRLRRNSRADGDAVKLEGAVKKEESALGGETSPGAKGKASDKSGEIPVYKCLMGSCGSFYHLDCVHGHPQTHPASNLLRKYVPCQACCSIPCLLR